MAFMHVHNMYVHVAQRRYMNSYTYYSTKVSLPILNIRTYTGTVCLCWQVRKEKVGNKHNAHMLVFKLGSPLVSSIVTIGCQYIICSNAKFPHHSSPERGK